MASEDRTAFLVIHGVGPHTPFQACDNFVRGFLDVFLDTEELREKKSKELRHEIKQRQNWLGSNIPWIQNYVSLTVPEKNTTVDFYEYYWDIYMTHKASFREAYKLLTDASVGARKFYKQHPEMFAQATDLGEFGRPTKFRKDKPEFKPGGYFKLLGPFFTVLSFLLPIFPPVITILNWWASTRLPIIGRLFEAFSVLMREPVPHFLGDAVRYLDLDPRSENFQTRRKIIDGAVEELRELINDDRYDRIIIACHSLGSVIAHDALNRIIHELNVDPSKLSAASKIVGIITFGSPLDKIACFFRAHIDNKNAIQRQVLTHLHGFKARPLDVEPVHIQEPDHEQRQIVEPRQKLAYEVHNPIVEPMNEIRWLNFYHTKDLISGRLDLYVLEKQSFEHLETDNGNIRIEGKFSGFTAHSCYWGLHKGADKGTNQMYEMIIKEFFT